MENNFDLIIPVAGKEAGFVHRVTMYARKNLEGLDCIYILTNKKHFKKIAKSLKGQRDITLLDENTLVDGLTFEYIEDLVKRYTNNVTPGWYFQQFLKYAFAFTSHAKQYYLSWDADTIPISKICFFENEHPLFTRKTEYNENYFKTIEKILGITKIVPFSFIAEHMVFNSDIVKEIVRKISMSSIEGNTWYEKILRAGDYSVSKPPYSEFETYGTYVTAYYPNLYLTRQLNTFRRGSLIRGRHISDKMLKTLSFDIDTVSFELRDKAPFPYNIPYIWWRFKDISYKIFHNKPNAILQKLKRRI